MDGLFWQRAEQDGETPLTRWQTLQRDSTSTTSGTAADLSYRYVGDRSTKVGTGTTTVPVCLDGQLDIACYIVVKQRLFLGRRSLSVFVVCWDVGEATLNI